VFQINSNFVIEEGPLTTTAGKYKVSISIQFTTSNPVIKAGTNDVSSTEADLHIELAIVVDWKSSVEPDPASSEAVDLVRFKL
jgi:hypothetical protein